MDAPVSESVVALITKAELDQAITTAKAFPRDVPAVIREIKQLVTLDEDTAESCIYTLPRGKGSDKKDLTGPSIRFAEIAFACWGNAICGGRAIAAEAEEVVAEGVFHDLQRNSKTIEQVRRRITTSTGRRYSADMIAVTGNAAAAVAKRNAIIHGIPKALWQPCYDAARGVAIGTKDTLPQRRTRAVEWFAHYGVDPASVCIRLGVATVMDITLEHLEILTGLKTAIRDGEDPRTAFAPQPTDKPATVVSKTTRPSETPHQGKAGKVDPPATTEPPKGEALTLTADDGSAPTKTIGELYRDVDRLLGILTEGDGSVTKEYEAGARKAAGVPESGDLDRAQLTKLCEELQRGVDEKG